MIDMLGGFKAIQAQEASLDRMDARQLKQMEELMMLLSGTIGGDFGGAGSDYDREAAMADTEALMAKGVRDFEQSILPQLTGAQEGAGASGSAITALLAQEAGIAKAGEVAEKQLMQIMGAEQLQSQQGMAAQSNMVKMLMQMMGTSRGGGVSTKGGSSSGRTPMTTLSKSTFVNPGPIYGPSDSNPTFSGSGLSRSV
jgi:hypothetical protein